MVINLYFNKEEIMLELVKVVDDFVMEINLDDLLLFGILDELNVVNESEGIN